MEFCHFLGCYLKDKEYGGKRLYDDMIEQAVLADTLGYCGIGQNGRVGVSNNE